MLNNEMDLVKLAYNELGKVLTIHILIDDIYAEVPWSQEKKIVDWTLIDYEPTRNSIQSAWNNWASDKNLDFELRDRPDLIPAPLPAQPDWNGYNIAMLQAPNYNRIANQSANQRAVSRLEIITADYASGANPNYSILQILWDSMIEGLSSRTKLAAEEIDNFNQIAQQFNMQFYFNAEGKLVFKN